MGRTSGGLPSNDLEAAVLACTVPRIPRLYHAAALDTPCDFASSRYVNSAPATLRGLRHRNHPLPRTDIYMCRDFTVRLDLAPSLNWLSRPSVISTIHSGELSIEPMPTIALLQELNPSSIPGQPHNAHVNCALYGVTIISPSSASGSSSPVSSTFPPPDSHRPGLNKTWSSSLLKIRSRCPPRQAPSAIRATSRSCAASLLSRPRRSTSSGSRRRRPGCRCRCRSLRRITRRRSRPSTRCARRAGASRDCGRRARCGHTSARASWRRCGRTACTGAPGEEHPGSRTGSPAPPPLPRRAAVRPRLLSVAVPTPEPAVAEAIDVAQPTAIADTAAESKDNAGAVTEAAAPSDSMTH